jgi:hypothetical protein
MFFVRLTQMAFWVYCLQCHYLHEPLYPFAVYRITQGSQVQAHLTAAEKWILGERLVDQVHEHLVFFGL